jgi:isopenicillin N synthase-like dioxygenase
MLADQDFSSVPVLNYALTKDPATRPEFLDRLTNALINVGFLYLSNPPVSADDMDLVIDYAPKLFTLPQEKKDKLLMRNNLHFLGYTKTGAEYTKGKADQREQYDFGTPYECRWTPGAPEYLKLWGPGQVSVIDLGRRCLVLTSVA